MADERYIIGFDLNDNLSQISYLELNSLENSKNTPETVSSDADKERLGIPTILSKRKGVAQWEYGTAAINSAKEGKSTLVNQLMSFAAAGAKLEIEGDAYDAGELLILFVRRTLTLLSMIMSPDQVECMVFTVESLEGRLVDVVERIANAMPVPRQKIIIQTYEESMYYYVIHQPKDIWEYEVCVMDYSNRCLKMYELWMNRRTQPVVAFVDKIDYPEIKMPREMMAEEESAEKTARLDESILRVVHEGFAGKSIGTVFLVGEGFEGGWCDKTFKYVCIGRRVFQGRNLYSKGACYSGKDKVDPGWLSKDYVFLGKDKLKFNLGIELIIGGKEQYVPIADAGENWYDCGFERELMLGDTKTIPLILTPLDGAGAETIDIELSGLPDRPKRASRQKLKVSFESEQRLKIEVRDLGFGEFYHSTGKVWEKIIELV